MSRCKYIVWSASEYIMFPESMSHSDMARKVMPYKAPVSAGFAEFSAEKDGSIQVITHGESVSLGIQAKGTDAHILKWMFNY